MFALQPSHVWFDRLAITKRINECPKSLEAAYGYVNEMINAEIDAGIPANRIVIGKCALQSIKLTINNGTMSD